MPSHSINSKLCCLQDKVGARSLEGRKLRRSVLKGSVIAFVTAGYSGKRFIFEKAHELGIKAIVLDAGTNPADRYDHEYADQHQAAVHCLLSDLQTMRDG